MILVAREAYKLRRQLTEDELCSVITADLLQKEEVLFQRAVGLLAISWAFVELALDYTNEIIITRGGIATHTKLPQSLRLKIALFRKYVFSHAPLVSTRTRGEQIIYEINELKIVRHDIIHGTANTRLPTGLREFQRHDYVGPRLVPYVKNYSLREIANATERNMALTTLIISYIREIDAILPENNPDDP